MTKAVLASVGILTICCCLSISGVPHGVAIAADGKTPTWEYKVEPILSELPGRLNTLGAEGWELVSAPQSGSGTFIFKRSK